MDIHLEQVALRYMRGTPFERLALQSINVKIPSGSIIGIIGHTGSGKSSLIQLIAGLIMPSEGSVSLDGMVWGDKKSYVNLRKKVGVVFQYPEYQLFEETVEKDIAFGPKNFGFQDEQIKVLVKDAMDLVHLPYDQYAKRSPFELSGGQMRRVAIAGVIAYQPDILILDEPTAGLDPKGRKEILAMIKRMHHTRKMTTLFVSHSMDEVANLADQLFVLHDGKIVLQGEPKYVFQQSEHLQQIGLDIPEITRFIQKLNEKLSPPIPLDCFSMDELETHIMMRLQKGKKS